MKYFRLTEEMGRRIPGRWTLSITNADDLEYGVPFKGKTAPARVFAGTEPLDFTGLGVPVARTELAAAIAAEVGEDMQRVPLSIKGHRGFEALNVLRVVDCIDLENSQLEPLDEAELAENRELGDPTKYRLVGAAKVFIDARRIPQDAQLFRLEGLENIYVIASERVKEAMERVGCLGAKFILMGERPDGQSKQPPKPGGRKSSSKTAPAKKTATTEAAPAKKAAKTKAAPAKKAARAQAAPDESRREIAPVKFYELSEDEELGQWVLGKIHDENGRRILLDSGIRSRAKRLTADIDEKGPPLDFCITEYNVPVARGELAAAIAREAGADVQRLPLRIKGHPGFEALNTVRVVPCLDEERSDIQPFTERELAEQRRLGLKDTFRLLGDLCIDGSLVPDDAHFFRPKGLEGVLLVSEQVKDAIERTGAKGPLFTLVGERPQRRKRSAP